MWRSIFFVLSILLATIFSPLSPIRSSVLSGVFANMCIGRLDNRAEATTHVKCAQKKPDMGFPQIFFQLTFLFFPQKTYCTSRSISNTFFSGIKLSCHLEYLGEQSVCYVEIGKDIPNLDFPPPIADRIE